MKGLLMNNVEIIKQHFLPLLIPKEHNAYTPVFLNAWKTSFINAVLQLQQLKKTPNKNRITREVLNNMSFESALDKYSHIINDWTPDKTLDVFWIKGMSIYTFNQYEVLKGFFQQYNDTLYNCLINVKDKHKTSNTEVLLKLAVNGDLTQKQYKKFETKHITLVKDKVPNIDDFKLLYKIGENHNSKIIWENYLKFYESNQIFIHNVKDFFIHKNIEYNFNEEELEIFSQSNFTRTLYVDPEYICKHNKNITASLLDNVVVSINNSYLKLAKEVENSAEMTTEYIKSGHRKIMINFNMYTSLVIYEEKIQNFNRNLKSMIENLQVDKNNTPEIYQEQIDKLYLYYKMNDKYDTKPLEKKIKI